MFRILVADDEKVTRKGIVAMLERSLKEEIEFIEAANGIEALEIVKQQMIHLVITDICMPLCSGLDFVKQLRDNDDEMTVIIISGYENFEYAKQAVRLGVKDYIMKPLHKENLLGLVESCLADIQKKQMDMQQHWQESQKQSMVLKEIEKETFLQVLQGINVQSGIQRLRVLDVMPDEVFMFVAVIAYETNRESRELTDFAVKNIVDECLEIHFSEKFYSMTGRGSQLIVVFSVSEMKQKTDIEKKLAEIVYLIEKFGRVKAIAGVGDFVFEPEKLSSSFEQAMIAADCKIFNTGEKVISYSGIPKIAVNECADNQMIADNYSEEKILERFGVLIKMGKSLPVIMTLRKEYENFIQYYNKRLKKNEALVGKKFSELWSDFEIRREIKEIFQYAESIDEESTTKKMQIVEDIIDFTRLHVTEDIDLNYIAETFGKTPGYIGVLFRKEMHLGFNEFVTGERIKIAKRLLKDHTLSVQKVGEMCGYYNPKYFSIVFKKAEGVSPKAYQMRQKKGD